MLLLYLVSLVRKKGVFHLFLWSLYYYLTQWELEAQIHCFGETQTCFSSGYEKSEFTFPRIKTLNANRKIRFIKILHINHIQLTVICHDPAQEKQLTPCYENTTQTDISLLSFLAALDHPLVGVQKFSCFQNSALVQVPPSKISLLFHSSDFSISKQNLTPLLPGVFHQSVNLSLIYQTSEIQTWNLNSPLEISLGLWVLQWNPWMLKFSNLLVFASLHC